MADKKTIVKFASLEEFRNYQNGGFRADKKDTCSKEVNKDKLCGQPAAVEFVVEENITKTATEIKIEFSKNWHCTSCGFWEKEDCESTIEVKA